MNNENLWVMHTKFFKGLCCRFIVAFDSHDDWIDAKNRHWLLLSFLFVVWLWQAKFAVVRMVAGGGGGRHYSFMWLGSNDTHFLNHCTNGVPRAHEVCNKGVMPFHVKTPTSAISSDWKWAPQAAWGGHMKTRGRFEHSNIFLSRNSSICAYLCVLWFFST